MEDLLELESADTSASRDVASRIQFSLKGTRDPSLLGQLVEFYFQTYSRRARRILTTLRETHSQDFFDKLNDCIWSQKILPVFKLLAHALSSQTTWLYRIVDHPLFSSILQQLEGSVDSVQSLVSLSFVSFTISSAVHDVISKLIGQMANLTKESEDVMVLTMGVFVVVAILPLVPTYIDSYLQRLFYIFCDLATIRATKRLGLTPHELVLHLDVSVYYLFLQLYALFPCNLFSFLKSYCENSTRAQVNAFQEFVPPLFYQVHLHPGLVTDSCAYELSKAKWGAMEPSDIATHSIQFCVDSLLAPESGAEGDGGDREDSRILDQQVTPTIPLVSSFRPTSLSLPPPGLTPLLLLSNAGHGITPLTSKPLGHTSSSSNLNSQQDTSRKISDLPATLTTDKPPLLAHVNPEGLKTSEELSHFWSPSISLGQMTTPGQSQSQSHSETASHQSSRTSMVVPPQFSTLSSPNSDSAVSSALQTPASVFPLGGSGGSGANGVSVFSYKNYSPTASVDSESLFNRQGLTQSAVLVPSRLEESLSSTDPLSQSMRVESGIIPRVVESPTKSSSLHGFGRRSAFRNKLGRFFDMFRKEAEQGEEANVSEEYIELFVSDANNRRSEVSHARQRLCEDAARKGVTKPQGTAAMKVEEGRAHPNISDGEESGNDSPVNSHRQSGMDGLGQLAALDSIEIDIPPVSNRPSRSDSESSEASAHQYVYRHSSDSPNAAGAGHFESMVAGHSYKELGAYSTAEATRISSSYPRSSVSCVAGGRGRGRRHTSNSETEISNHAHQLQDKLQRLVEHKEPGGSIEASREGSILDSHTPMVENSDHHLNHPSDTQPPTGMDAGPLHTSAHTLPTTGLAMRRLSICSRRGIGVRLTSESSSGGTLVTSSQGDPREPSSLILKSHPSPLALLDQFVSCGEVLHRGDLNTIPLTEQEGVNWNHFGGCPHSEEFRIMQSQVVLLHSQLLFERYQCVQHARRNRRLLSKARSAAHVTEELVSLRDQLHQQEALMSSLKQQLRKVTEGQSAKQQLLSNEERSLARENVSLKDANAKLREELWRTQERNKRLEEELKRSNEKLGNLRNERQQLEPRLQHADQLQSEITVLSRQYHEVEELYRQQKEKTLSLQSQSRQGWEWKAQCAALLREKEARLRQICGLGQSLGACQARLRELEGEGSEKQQKLNDLRIQLEEERGRSWSKMKVLEKKYGSMKVIGQQLECHVMELKSHSPLQRKRNHSTKHRRNPSAPPNSTPSPIAIIHRYTHNKSLYI